MTRAALIAEARSWLGTPWGQNQALKGAGCDCVGLINALHSWVTGLPLAPMPAYAWDFAMRAENDTLQAAALEYLTPIRTPRPGDVLAFRWARDEAWAHCGLMVSEARMIHARAPRGVVETTIPRKHLAASYAMPGLVD